MPESRLPCPADQALAMDGNQTLFVYMKNLCIARTVKIEGLKGIILYAFSCMGQPTVSGVLHNNLKTAKPIGK